MLGKMIVVDGNNFDQLLPTVLFSIWVPQSSTGFTPSSFINLLKKCLELVLPQLPALSVKIPTQITPEVPIGQELTRGRT
jgi:hypothetical protein